MFIRCLLLIIMLQNVPCVNRRSGLCKQTHILEWMKHLVNCSYRGWCLVRSRRTGIYRTEWMKGMNLWDNTCTVNTFVHLSRCSSIALTINQINSNAGCWLTRKTALQRLTGLDNYKHNTISVFSRQTCLELHADLSDVLKCYNHSQWV